MSKVYKQLSELGEIITGKTPSTSNNDLWDGDIPFITPTDINGYETFYQFKTERYVSNLGALKQKKTILPPNSVCITCIGSTIGKPCVTKVESITNQQINSIIPNSENDFRYVYYLIRENLPYLQLIGGGSGSGTPIISKNKFAKFKFLVEDNLCTQRRIASILSAYDNLIENNNRRIRLLEQMAENLYKEWFVRFRFPGHENAEFENGLPKGWRIGRLSEYGRVETGKTPSMSKQEYYGGDYLFIKTPDMHGNMFVRETEETLSDKGNLSQPKKLLPKGSIMVSCIGSGGVVAINAKQGHTNQQINSVILSNMEDLEWLYFTCKALKPMIELFGATGATMTNLSKGKFERLKVVEPSFDLRKLFHLKTKSIFDEILKLDENIENLSRQRDLLLPRLMSGKIEVNI